MGWSMPLGCIQPLLYYPWQATPLPSVLAWSVFLKSDKPLAFLGKVWHGSLSTLAGMQIWRTFLGFITSNNHLCCMLWGGGSFPPWSPQHVCPFTVLAVPQSLNSAFQEAAAIWEKFFPVCLQFGDGVFALELAPLSFYEPELEQFEVFPSVFPVFQSLLKKSQTLIGYWW